jgi:hypothetical protein
MKNGKIQSPILIKTIYKDDEGIKWVLNQTSLDLKFLTSQKLREIKV